MVRYIRYIDTERDVHRFNSDVHYRLYDSEQFGPTVVCVQDFDYRDYDGHRFMSYEAFATEAEAEACLEQITRIAKSPTVPPCSVCQERMQRIAQLRHELNVLERLVAECEQA